MKKTLIFCLSCILLIQGCAKNDPYADLLDPNNPVTITLWHYYTDMQKSTLDRLIDEFNETVGLEEGIFIEASNVGHINELSEKVIDASLDETNSKFMPDIFTAYADTAYQVNNLGYVADLSEYFSEDELDTYVDGYIEEGRIDGFKIFPTIKSTECLQINKQAWLAFSSATGVSERDLSSYEGISAVAKKYYEYTDAMTLERNDGKAFFGRDAVANYIIVGLKQLDVELFEIKDDEVILNVDDQALRKIYDNYYIPYISGYFTAKGRFRSDDMKKGNIIAYIGSTSAIPFFPKQVYEDDNTSIDVEPLFLNVPVFEGGEKVAVQQGAGMIVTKKDEVSEYASTIFLKWFTEVEQNLEFTFSTAYLPVKKAANDFKLVEKAFENSDEEHQILLDGLRIAVDTVNNYELYTTKSFSNGNHARRYIEEYMNESCEKDRLVVIERLNKNEELSSIINDYESDGAYQTWFKEFESGLSKIIFE